MLPTITTTTVLRLATKDSLVTHTHVPVVAAPSLPSIWWSTPDYQAKRTFLASEAPATGDRG